MKYISFLIALLPFCVAAQSSCGMTFHTDGSVLTICVEQPFDSAGVEVTLSNGLMTSFRVGFSVYSNGLILAGETADGVPFSQFMEHEIDEYGEAVYVYEFDGEEYGMYFTPLD
jgi:hypothetical protein